MRQDGGVMQQEGVVMRQEDSVMREQRSVMRQDVFVMPEHGIPLQSLNWRIEKVADTPSGPFGVRNGTLDQKRSMYYSANWQLLEERIDDDIDAQEPPPHSIDRHMQYIWGNFRGRSIDDILMRRENRNFSNDSPNITYDEVYYHCTDAQFSSVAVLDSAARVLERVIYDEYGQARLIDDADLNGDGLVNSADETIFNNNYSSTDDCPRPGDLDRDGIVFKDDDAILQAATGTAYGFGRLSGSTDNIIGWCGYVFNHEIDFAGGGMYTVRFRHYRPSLARWLERDPVGHLGGPTLYGYLLDNPIVDTDAFGLAPQLCAFAGVNNGGENYVLEWLKRLDLKVHGNCHSGLGTCDLLLNSEYWLDKEAREEADRLPRLCKSKNDRARVRVLMVAPKTDTKPPTSASGCCDIEVITIWSPYDGVPNQSIGNKPIERELWPIYGDDYPVESRPNGKGGRGITPHDFRNFTRQRLRCLKLVPGTIGRPGNHWVEDPNRGPLDLKQMVQDMMSGDDGIVAVCHSQGCNILMEWLNKACKPCPQKGNQ